jgi:hypothetical protein
MRVRTLVLGILAGVVTPVVVVVALMMALRPDPAAEQAALRVEAAAFHVRAAGMALAQQRISEARVHLQAARRDGAGDDAAQRPELERLEGRLMRAERLQALELAVYAMERQAVPDRDAVAACAREAQVLAADTGLSAAEAVELNRLQETIAAQQKKRQTSPPVR